MKKMRRLAGLLLAMVMVMSMAVSVFADETTYSITINNSVAGHTYEAYQIFTGDLNGNATNDNVDGTNAVLSNVVWGSSVSKYDGNAVTAGADATAVVETITGTNLEAFIAKLELVNPVKTVNTQTDNTYVISGLKPGYYLIKDMNGSLTGDNDSYTEYILEVVENSTLNPKSDVPEVEKKVKDINDSVVDSATDWQDSADYDIGDKVPFKLTGTLPTNYSEYSKYKMIFHDTLSEGLSQPVITSVYLADKDGNKVTNFASGDYSLDATDEGFKITFANLKESTLSAQIGNSMKIVVEYTSVLNSEAKIGAAGNPNEVTLEFSNDPNYDGEGEPDTGETPKDKVIVFTYKVNVDKVTGPENNREDLTGAGFTLYKEVPANTENAKTGKDIKKDFAANVKAVALADDKYYIVASEVETDEAGDTFGFKGVDDGTYVLVETTIPDGYNSWEAVEFKIEAAHDSEKDDPELTSLTGGDLVTGDFKETGIIDTDIVNNAGTTLPETGGMGTTLFYVIGATLAIGAAVVMVTRKRMSAN